MKNKVVKESAYNSIKPGTILKCVAWNGPYFTVGNFYRVKAVEVQDDRVIGVIVNSNVLHTTITLTLADYNNYFSEPLIKEGYWR